MARRKGATNKNKNTGTRKTILENAQLFKKTEKDDPGGKMEEIGRKTKKSYKSITSKSGINKDATETILSNSNSEQPQQQQQSHRQMPHRNNDDLVFHENKTTEPPSNSSLTSDSKDLSKINNSDNSLSNSNNNDSCNSRNSNLHQSMNNNHNKIVNSTVNVSATATATTTDPSTYQKYLHKKFKRIASATESLNDNLTKTSVEATTTQQRESLESTTVVQPLIQSNGHVNGNSNHILSSSSSPNSTTARTPTPPQTTALSVDTVETSFDGFSKSSSGASAPPPVKDMYNKYKFCPYCDTFFSKPSVLEKHIRTHTNERPYPCEPCNLAFKTKSNYYKHCRSKSHIQKTPDRFEERLRRRMEGIYSDEEQDVGVSNSSSDIVSRTTSPIERSLSPEIKNILKKLTQRVNSSNPSPPLVQQQQQQQNQSNELIKPYKPKFHNAALYTSKEEVLKEQHPSKPLSPFQTPNKMVSNHNSPTPTPTPPPQTPQITIFTSNNIQILQQQRIQPDNVYHQKSPSSQQQSQFGQQSFPKHISPQQQQKQLLITSPHNELYQISRPSSTQPSSTISLNRDRMSPNKNLFGNQRILTQQIDVSSPYHVLSKQQQQKHQQQLQTNVSTYTNSKVFRSQDIEVGSNTIAPMNPSTYFQQINEQQKMSNSSQQQDVVDKKRINLVEINNVGNRNDIIKSIIITVPETNGSTAVTNSINSGVQPLNLEERINNLITQNEVILENKEPLLKNKKSKTLNRQKSITSMPNSAPPSSSTNTKLAQTITMKQQQQQQYLQAQASTHQQKLIQQVNGFYPQKITARPQVQIVQQMEQQPISKLCLPSTNTSQPLNLSKLNESSPIKNKNDEPVPLNEASSLASAAAAVLARNPERSIIKNLLLAKEQQEKIDRTDSTQAYMCTVCQMAFRSSDELKNHTNYCTSGLNHQSGSRSPRDSPSYKYFNSNTFMSIPDVTNPSSLLTLATSAMSKSIAKLAWSQLSQRTKPSNLIMNHLNAEATTSANSKALIAWSMQMGNDSNTDTSSSASPALIDTSLPSPGPRLGKTALVESYQPTADIKKNDDVIISKVHNDEISVPQEKQKEQHQQQEEKELHKHSKRFKTQQQESPVKQATITPLPIVPQVPLVQHFKFPPINQITAFNPLTLSMVADVADKNIPYVPGIPGPNTLLSIPSVLPPPQNLLRPSPNNAKSISPNKSNNQIESTFNMRLKPIGSSNSHSQSIAWNPVKDKKSFNFARMADNLSPKKSKTELHESETYNKYYDKQKPELKTLKPLSIDVIQASSSPPSTHVSDDEKKKNKFLRPSSLPLKPGTFTPKRHHGITPTANTLPLISPETPRPSKSCAQMYLNGHAYTYLGLKCSTKMFYCTVNCPQPTYVANNHRLSMYSKWQAVPDSKPHPMKLDQKKVMSLYDSRPYLNFSVTLATTSLFKYAVSEKPSTPIMHALEEPILHNDSISFKTDSSSNVASGGGSVTQNSGGGLLIGGYESNEDYTYIRGRGRGRYVCSECGIRCKKPSMLKKHIRTHTDVRPYTCKYCNFSFKTKGNLTKHMQSKAHYKKCLELGIYKGPMPADSEFPENDNDIDQQSINSGGGRTSSIFGESDSDDFSDNDEESSDTDESKSRLPEHEAAHCLLSLSMTKGTFNSFPQSSCQQNLDTIQALPSKRIVSSYSSPKPPYEFKHDGKYYPKPEVSKSKMIMKSDECTKPIDLTKPKKNNEQPTPINCSKKMPIKPTPVHKPIKYREVIGEISTETGMLKSLVSLTDMVRGTIESSNINTDENILPQNYLTEQALHQSKIKQCQMQQPSTNLTVSINTVKSTAIESLTIPPSSTSSATENAQTSLVINRQNDIFDSLKRGDKQIDSTSNFSNLEKTMEESDDSLSDQELFIPPITSSNSNDFINLFGARKVVVGEEGNFKNPSSNTGDSVQPMFPRTPISEDGKPVCTMCSKVFQKQHQLVLHMNIHYMERKFKCEPCAVSFRTQGHLQKHERSEAHKNKVMMTSTFGVPTTTNPRPFECTDCKIAFRIHGHLAKHLRSKTHVQKLECLQKLPFGTYAEIERAGINLTEIDTTDCENSLISLKVLAHKLFEKDPTKLSSYTGPSNITVDSGASHGESGDSDQEMASELSLPVKRKTMIAIDNSHDHQIEEKRQKTESAVE